MGGVASKCYGRCRHHRRARKLMKWTNRIRSLEEEVDQLRRARVEEVRSHQRTLSAFASTEESRRAERKVLEGEAARLERQLAEAEDRARRLQAAASSADKERRPPAAGCLVETMEAERARRRDDAAAKWKQLYLAIKAELDDLIQRTWQGERMFWGTEEVRTEKLRKELKAKDETMETLRAWITVMEKEGARRDREIDILRQSLRILSNKRRSRIRPKGPPPGMRNGREMCRSEVKTEIGGIVLRKIITRNL